MALELHSPKEFLETVKAKNVECIKIKVNKTNTKLKICTKERLYTFKCPEKYREALIASIPENISVMYIDKE